MNLAKSFFVALLMSVLVFVTAQYVVNENEKMQPRLLTKVSNHEVEDDQTVDLIPSAIRELRVKPKLAVIEQEVEEVEIVEEEVIEEQVKEVDEPVVTVVEPQAPTPVVQAETAPAPVVQPVVSPTPVAPPVVVAPTTPANHLMFAGSSSYYQFVGQYNPSEAQRVIDSGIISSSVVAFNPSDGQTTYFAGHNPGVMSAYYSNLQIGSIVSVSDSAGNIYQYQMTDVVATNTKGGAVFPTLGISAAHLYYMGSGQESIAIQYCVNGSSDMRVWYGVKI